MTFTNFALSIIFAAIFVLIPVGCAHART